MDDEKSDINFSVGVVLPAAGSGERLGQASPKQYHSVLGRPLLTYAVEAFCKFPYVSCIVVASDNVERARSVISELGFRKVEVVAGGKTRHRSISAGLQALTRRESPPSVVIVHDAVRPLVPAALVRQLVLLAWQHGAAGAIRPLVSTVICCSGDGTELEAALDRSKYRASEMPQAFQLSLLVGAFAKCSDNDLDCGTELLHLVDIYGGVKARLIEGPTDLFKVTLPHDLYRAEGCLRENLTRICVVAPPECPLINELERRLTGRVACFERIAPNTTRSHSPGYQSAVFIHEDEISTDGDFVDLCSSLDVSTGGAIVHVLDHTSKGAAPVRSATALDVHRSGAQMALQYLKLRKSVAVIHWISAGEEKKVAGIVAALLLQEDDCFSGQTLLV